MAAAAKLMERVGTRGRIVLLAISAALPTIAFAAYLLVHEDAARADALAYGMAALGAALELGQSAWLLLTP